MAHEKTAHEKTGVEMLVEFSAGAGHELNNPLAAISGRVQLLLRGESDAAKRSELALILNHVRRAQDMIADLRLVACPPLPRKSVFSVREFVQNLADSCRCEWAGRKIELAVRIATNGVDAHDFDIYADSTQLEILLRALFKNSLRAIGAEGSILLCAERDDARQEIVFRVSDTGGGIPSEIRELLFDPYFSSYQSGRGLGFGLTKARAIAHLHGGEIELDEAAEETTFVLTLPIATEAASS
ncbi:MAG: HAMP domain-containing sensor histidine kinase [Planctomycetia bacterium]|nr:HAMP domain-containing sensor histidine kinase [Planctomycetia bacterium]